MYLLDSTADCLFLNTRHTTLPNCTMVPSARGMPELLLLKALLSLSEEEEEGFLDDMMTLPSSSTGSSSEDPGPVMPILFPTEKVPCLLPRSLKKNPTFSKYFYW